MVEPLDERLFEMLSGAMAHIHNYIEPYENNNERSRRLQMILLGIINSAAEIEEIKHPGSGAYLWAEVEAGAKQGGLLSVAKKIHAGQKYSISEMSGDDFPGGMNYLGQKLAETLFKHIHDLPEPLRKPEMLLRAVEVLLANLLNQSFQGEDAHALLDSLCEHVHMALEDLTDRKALEAEPEEQEKFVAEVDAKVKLITLQGGDETSILIGLFEVMPKIKELMSNTPRDKMSEYYVKYKNFYRYIKVLETLAVGIANGDIVVPK